MAFEGLQISRSGVAASQRALDVIAHNIANVSTPGHSRQRVEQVSTERLGPSLLLGPGANGAGVAITSVSRAGDVVLDANVRSELGNSASLEVGLQTLSEIERALGPHADGLSEALTAFWNGWEEVSLDSSSATARAQVIGAAESLSRALSGAAQEVDMVHAANVATASTKLEEQNTALAEVARLNGEIRAQHAIGDNANAMMDERDRQVDQLASSLGAKVHMTDGEMMNISVGGFEVVRGTNHSSLSISGDPGTMQTDNGSTIASGGEIGARLFEGQAATTQVIAELDSLATTLRDVVNAQHQLGFDLAGTAGGDLFSATSAADFGLASGFTADLLAASSSGASADGNHALDMAGLRNQNGVSGTLNDQARSIVGRIGAAVLTAQTRADANDGVLATLQASRGAVSGVNLDEELTMLLQYQRSYEASARVMTSVDQMLDVLINRTGLVGR
jgi:flagellar hook-associated protein 1 FlgK